MCTDIFDKKFKKVLMENNVLEKLFAKIAIQILAEGRVELKTKKTIDELLYETEEYMINAGIICTKTEITEAVSTWTKRSICYRAEKINK